MRAFQVEEVAVALAKGLRGEVGGGMGGCGGGCVRGGWGRVIGHDSRSGWWYCGCGWHVCCCALFAGIRVSGKPDAEIACTAQGMDCGGLK